MRQQRLSWYSKYGTPIAVVAAFALLLALAPSKSPEQSNEFAEVAAGDASAESSGSQDTTTDSVADGGTVIAGDTTSPTVLGTQAGRTTTGRTTTRTGSTSGATTTGGSTAAAPTGSVPPNAVAGASTPGADCARVDILGTNDWGCKPAWEGNNGGATYSKGVSGDTIKVVFYVGQTGAVLAEEPQSESTIVCGITPGTTEDFDKTIEVYEQFFNKHWQLYGRKIDMQVFRAQALSTDSAATRSEAVKVDQQIKPFLLINSFANEFVDETSRRGIVNFGGVGLSSEFLKGHAPFVFQLGQDTDTQNKMLAEYIAKRVDAYPIRFTGDPSQGSNPSPARTLPRKYAVLYPGDAAQQLTGMGDDMLARLQSYGIPASRMKKYGYQSDATTWATQAPNLVAQMKADNITNMLIMVNPAFISFFTQAATAQSWFPEYIVTDFDLQGTSAIPRAVATNPGADGRPTYSQWKRAYGLSFNAAPPDVQQKCNGSRWERWGHKAYKSIDPGGEPHSGFIIPFVGLLHAFQALENAGPKLDPGTYANGVFKIKATPPTSKTDDQRGYGPGDYSGSEDIVEIWWNPTKNTRGAGNTPGEYEYAADGMRYGPGQIPVGETEAFQACSTAPGGCTGSLPKWPGR
jgi:hypothetical protein